MTKRVFIEVFKYFSFKYLFTVTSLVCKEWKKTAYSDEILLIFLFLESEADHVSNLSLYQRLKEAKIAIRHLACLSDSTLSLWHLTEPDSSPILIPGKMYQKSSRYSLISHTELIVTGGDRNSHSCCMLILGKYVKMRVLASMVQPHAWHGMTTKGKRVYVSGGIGKNKGNHPYAEKLEGKRWISIGNMTVARCNHTLSPYKDRIYAFGGSFVSLLDSIEYYDGRYWTLTGLKLPFASEFLSVLPVNRGLVVVSSTAETGYVHLFEERTQQWVFLHYVTGEHSLSNAVALRNERLWVYGCEGNPVSLEVKEVWI